MLAANQLQTLQQQYQSTVDSLMAGRSEDVLRFIDGYRRKDQKTRLEELVLRLLTVRMALKAGNQEIEVIREQLPVASVDSEAAFFNGEIQVVNALIALSQERFKEARTHFESSYEIFAQMGLSYKSLLGAFNAIAARCEYDEAFTNSDIRHALAELMNEADRYAQPTIKALCARFLSHLLLDENKFAASLEMAKVSGEIFAEFGPVSDFLLNRAHISLCLILLGDKEAARVEYELIPEGSDHRLQFPMALLRKLLFGDEIQFDDFTYVSGRWQSNYEQFVQPSTSSRRIVWDLKSTVLIEDGKILDRIRSTSREGFLLKQLGSSPRTRSWLFTSLWPEVFDVELLEDRLDKLVRRINKKLNGAIELQSGVYRLKVEITRK